MNLRARIITGYLVLVAVIGSLITLQRKQAAEMDAYADTLNVG